MFGVVTTRGVLAHAHDPAHRADHPHSRRRCRLRLSRSRRRVTPMDAITLLRNDHRTVEDLFKKFEKAGTNAHKTKARLVEKMTHELAVHAAIEEMAFYPAVKGMNDKLTDSVLESLEEHHIVKWVLSELERMEPKDERFDAKVTVLMENVRHHVKEEERELFPAVRKAMSRKDLVDLAEILEKAKKTAPTHAHPRSPDEPP